MTNNVTKKLIKKDNFRSYYLLTKTCSRCQKEFTSKNIVAALYCPECSKIVEREKTRERVKQYRQRKAQKESGINAIIISK